MGVHAVAHAWNRSKARVAVLQPLIHWGLLILCLAPVRVLYAGMTFNWRIPDRDFVPDVTYEVCGVALLLMLTMMLDMSCGRVPPTLPRAIARHRAR